MSATVTYHTADIDDRGIITLSDGGDHETIILVDRVDMVDVDWTIASGHVSISSAYYTRHVEFAEDDHGQECSDFISALFKQWREVVTVP